MKILLFGIALAAFGTACTQQKPASAATSQSAPGATAVAAAAHFSCPMHPEVTGKAGDKCPKCNMDLTHTEHTAATHFSCPMHPEITGKAGDKCSKCKMDLTRTAHTATEVYACPMHPEITGKAGDKCPKCKMDLKPVKK